MHMRFSGVQLTEISRSSRAHFGLTPISSRARVAWLDPPGGREPRTKWLQDRSAATSDVRGLLGRSRRPPIRGHTSAVPRHGLRGVGCLKQLPKPVFQLFDGLPQGAELPNPDYRDGRVQLKRWGTQYFHGIDRMIPGNKASRQQPDTIPGLNNAYLQIPVVNFSPNHSGK